MKVSDVQYGKAKIIEVRPSSADDFGALSALVEVDLYRAEMESEVLLRAGGASWTIEGVDAHHQELLNNLLVRSSHRLAWIVARRPKDNNLPAASLIVEVREFQRQHIWYEPVDLGVDEKIVEVVRKKRKSLSTTSDVITWLREQVLITGAEESCRVLLSGSPTPQADRQSGFRLHGQGIAVDVARDAKDRLLVTRVVEAKRAVDDTERRPVLLVHGQFQFVDHTIAGQFRGAARSELDQIVSGAESYLAIWREYNKLERRSIWRRAREFGWLTYHSRQPLANGSWRFHVNDDERLEQCIRSLEESESVTLEAAIRPPLELSQVVELDGEEEDTRNGGRIFAGEYIAHNRQRLTIDILPIRNDEDRNPPPDKGVLFMSLGGDRTRLERRRKAQALIASAECPMPQLGLLLEGKDVHESRRRKERPLSQAARDAFDGEPTSRQVEALNVALNTPDIALIQGPPGTGKTRTIAALQARLSEITEDTDGLSGRYLLTSYQHDAVENVASATQVFGLPAIKVGRKRGQSEETDGFERWRQDRVEAIRAKLATSKELPASVALRRCRNLAVGYLKAPSRTDDVSALLITIRDMAAPHVHPAITDQLLELAQRLRHPSRPTDAADPALEQALNAVRGLRISVVAFSDDGNIQARKALRRLQRLGVAMLEAPEQILLEKAAEWDVDVEPDFLDALAALQSTLINRLLPNEKPASVPLVNSDVELALSTVLGAIREKVRTSRGGVAAVLHEFCDDLENNRKETRETVEHYTVVLAATCQQAVGYHMNQRKGDNNIFDTVVVDEAARANPLDLFIPMALAERRIILVGDHRQLPHILDHEIENDLDSDVSEKTQEMLRTSLFQRLFAQLRERERADGIKRTVTLDVQYRMHPVLGRFVSDTFYASHDEGFTSERPETDFVHNLTRYKGAVAAWVDIPLGRGAERRGQSKNRLVEASWIAHEAHRLLTERPDFSVGVITFYSAQVNEILRQMEPLGMTEPLEGSSFRVHESWKTTRDESGKLKERLRIGTVDAFQGKEFDVVLLSMTRSNDIVADQPRLLRSKYGHLMLENRLCVAMSRQQRLLVVVGDSGMLKGEQAAKAVPGLVRFMELCGGEHGVQLHA